MKRTGIKNGQSFFIKAASQDEIAVDFRIDVFRLKPGLIGLMLLPQLKPAC